jgi:hypothetical protein
MKNPWMSPALGEELSLRAVAFGDVRLVDSSLTALAIPATLEPRFKEFPVNEVFRGKPAAVVFERAEERRFRTVIRSGATIGPNFAGHYTLVEWGCGTECFQAAIVDAKTGRIYQPPLFDKERHDFFEASWLHFRPDSNLMIVCVDCPEVAGSRVRAALLCLGRRPLHRTASRASTRSARSH